jgi:hypothetical protein
LDSEAGPLEIPLAQVTMAAFGGPAAPQHAAARLRLIDGSAICVERFRGDAKEVVAHSAVLGDLQIPSELLAELILDPAPPRLPFPLIETAERKDAPRSLEGR